MVVAAQSHCKALRLAIVVEQLLVLVAQVIDHVLVLLGAICEYFEPLGSADRPRHKLGSRALLEVLLLVGEVEFPFVETVAEVCLTMLLAIRQKVEPVFEDFSHFDILAPSVEHFWLEVVIGAVIVLPAGYRLG